MKARDLVGTEVMTRQYGKALVISVPHKAKTTLNIRVTQRGPGWHEPTETYRPVKSTRPNPDAGPGAVTVIRTLTNRDEYGIEDTIHIKDVIS